MLRFASKHRQAGGLYTRLNFFRPGRAVTVNAHFTLETAAAHAAAR
jgi:hypothetical protein